MLFTVLHHILMLLPNLYFPLWTGFKELLFQRVQAAVRYFKGSIIREVGKFDEIRQL